MTVKSSDGPRYAPEDPSLPKPWRGLVDGKTGYLYFWNPVTNVTQYERPSAATPAASDDHDDACGHINRHQGGRVVSPGSHTDPAISRRDPSDDHARGYSAPYSRTSGQGHGYASASSGEAYRRQHEITVIGDDAPDPFTTFESAGFPSEILREVYYQVHQVGFSAPTPIQAQSWPIALSHRDVVAVAKTGSGKTLGYLIPAFIHLKHLCNNSKIGPVVLVLSPTRELATQIQEEAVKFGRSSRISSVCLYGGAPKGPQLRDLSKGADIVVATPGRLNDILEMKKVSLHQVSYLVLDEADRMLDMGFEPQIQKIVKEIPPRRQTLMFTATWPKEVRKIAADLLVNPIQVNIGNIDELVANKAITQYVEVITPMQKQRRLGQILNSQEPGSKIIIFCSTKRMCDQLARALSGQFGASAIHGDKSQSERDWVLNQFRTGRSPILVATDVAARGLDIKDIRVVINYDFPTGVEDYVHRIGRTGRAGATGISYTFFCDQDSKYASDLIKVLEGASQHVPSELRDLARHSGYGGNSRRWRPGNDDHNGGRFHGGTCSESSYDGGGGWGQPLSSGWSDSFASRPHSPPLNRYDRADGRGCHNPKSIMAGSETFGAGRGRSRSAKRSRSPYRGCSEWGGSESPVQKLWTS